MKKMYHVVLILLGLIIPASSVEVAAANNHTWSEKSAPNYVMKVGKAVVSKKPKKGVIKYSKLDKYKRPGRVYGNITYAMVKKSAGWREDIKVNPTGWPKSNPITSINLYNGKQYRGYFWNRSHLIADSLGGKAIKRNLITGTRMQNVGSNNGKGGMAYTERKTVNWIYAHKKGSVYYSAKPVYNGKEKLPRSVIVDVKSSDGKLNERVVVYNAAKGFNINYYNGTFSEVKEKTTTQTPKAVAGVMVYRTKTGTKYHSNKECYGLRNANSITEVTLSVALDGGLEPCSICYGH